VTLTPEDPGLITVEDNVVDAVLLFGDFAVFMT
jgi:hypothetical protein